MVILVRENFYISRSIFFLLSLFVVFDGAVGQWEAAPVLPDTVDEVKAPDDPEALLEACMLALYDFRFLKADAVSLHLLDSHPDNYLSHFARAHYYWWMMISHPPDDETVVGFSKSIQHAGNLFEKRNAESTNPDHPGLFYAISLSAMSVRHDLMVGNYIPALNRARNAHSSIKKSLGQEDAFHGLYLTSGLYNYIAGSAVSRFPLLRIYQLLFPAGDKELGLSQLKRAADLDHPVWKTEATYFLMRIFLEMEGDPERAVHYAQKLTGRFPENLIYHYYHLLALREAGEEQAALNQKQVIRNAAMFNEGLSDVQREYFLELSGE